MGVGGQRHTPATLLPIPTVQEAGWVPELFWTGAENLVPTGFRYADHPACSELLYQLGYRGPHTAILPLFKYFISSRF